MFSSRFSVAKGSVAKGDFRPAVPRGGMQRGKLLHVCSVHVRSCVEQDPCNVAVPLVCGNVQRRQRLAISCGHVCICRNKHGDNIDVTLACSNEEGGGSVSRSLVVWIAAHVGRQVVQQHVDNLYPPVHRRRPEGRCPVFWPSECDDVISMARVSITRRSQAAVPREH